MIKYLTCSFRKLNYFSYTVSVLSLLVCIHELPVLALANTGSKTYIGTHSNVTVRCTGLKGGNAEGGYSINGTKSGTRITGITGFSIFNHDVKTTKFVNDQATDIVLGDLIFSGEIISYYKANYSNKRATRFATSFMGSGYDGAGNGVLVLPESDEKFKYEINCPSVK